MNESTTPLTEPDIIAELRHQYPLAIRINSPARKMRCMNAISSLTISSILALPVCASGSKPSPGAVRWMSFRKCG